MRCVKTLERGATCIYIYIYIYIYISAVVNTSLHFCLHVVQSGTFTTEKVIGSTLGGLAMMSGLHQWLVVLC